MTTHMSRRAALAGLASLTGLAAASARAAPAAHNIAVTDMAFVAPAGPLVMGDEVLWDNQDIFRHTATARDGSFDLDLPPGGQARMTLTAAGPVEVFCRFHPGMKLTLTVSAA